MVGRTPNDYQKGTGQRVCLYLEPLCLSMVNQIAKRYGISQSEAVRNCIREMAKALDIK